MTVQAGVLGLITIFAKEPLKKTFWSIVMVACFALSICVATWVLGSLPSIVQRLQPNSNLHRMDLFEWLPVKGSSSFRVEIGSFVTTW